MLVSIGRVLIFTVLVAAGMARAAEPSLPHWIGIDWHRGPDLPQAFQDSDGGIVNGTLITTCGYCDSGATGPPEKRAKAPSGFHKKTWGLDLANPQAGWQTLPDFPGDARQELFAIVVGDSL